MWGYKSRQCQGLLAGRLGPGELHERLGRGSSLLEGTPSASPAEAAPDGEVSGEWLGPNSRSCSCHLGVRQFQGEKVSRFVFYSWFGKFLKVLIFPSVMGGRLSEGKPAHTTCVCQ